MDAKLIEKVIEFAERSDPLSTMLSWGDTELLTFIDSINPDFQGTMNKYDEHWPEPGELNPAYFCATHLAFFLGAVSALRVAGYKRNQLKAIIEMWIRAVSNQTSGIFEPCPLPPALEAQGRA